MERKTKARWQATSAWENSKSMPVLASIRGKYAYTQDHEHAVCNHLSSSLRHLIQLPRSHYSENDCLLRKILQLESGFRDYDPTTLFRVIAANRRLLRRLCMSPLIHYRSVLSSKSETCSCGLVLQTGSLSVCSICLCLPYN